MQRIDEQDTDGGEVRVREAERGREHMIVARATERAEHDNVRRAARDGDDDGEVRIGVILRDGVCLGRDATGGEPRDGLRPRRIEIADRKVRHDAEPFEHEGARIGGDEQIRHRAVRTYEYIVPHRSTRDDHRTHGGGLRDGCLIAHCFSSFHVERCERVPAMQYSAPAFAR